MKRSLLPKLASLMTPMALIAATSPTAITLPGERLFPESVSIAPNGFAYVGSMTGGVLRVKMRTGAAETFIAPGAFGSGSLYGVLADLRNHMLWICTNDFSTRGLAVPGADAGHLLKGFDIRSGKGKISLALPGKTPVCNDIAVAADGSVFVTDTGAPQVLRWQRGQGELAVWANDPILASARGGGLDGIAIGGDGNLILNNVRDGSLYRIVIERDGSAGKITKLDTSRPLASPDGMRPIGDGRFALAEGTGRIDQVTVLGDRAEIQTLAESIASPTGVDVYAGAIWYVQGQLSYLFDPAKRGTTPAPFRLTPVAIPKYEYPGGTASLRKLFRRPEC